jgi:hypothetical protein
MFSGWGSFFALTGSAGAGLVGLLFVVVTLGADLSTSRRLDVARALLTPALISFTDVLLQGMIVLVPWPSDRPSGILFLLLGIGGLIYRVNAVRVRIQHVRLKAIDGPIDWTFHNILPVVGSVSVLAGGAGLIAGAASAPFAVAGSTACLLVSGIYRTWSETLVLVAPQDKP